MISNEARTTTLSKPGAERHGFQAAVLRSVIGLQGSGLLRQNLVKGIKGRFVS
jgi:hypothetical protein